MKPIEVAVIGTGWCGGIRAETLAAHPLVKALHLAEINKVRLQEIKAKTKPKTAGTDYKELLKKTEIEAVYISATPETTHYPIARDCLAAGKHVFLEKPIALTLEEADEVIKISKDKKLKFSIGYSQRFNPKFAYVRQCIRDGTIGRPVSALVSRHITRSLGKKISGRVKLSPAAMESTHDLDFLLWCLEPARPVRVYSQQNFGLMQESSGQPIADTQWITVTLDSGLTFVVGGGWTLPLGYPNFSTTWIEMVGTEGAVMVDDSHRDVVLNTVKKGMQLPMSTMPGEFVEHTYAGAMAPETVHFLEACVYERPVLNTVKKGMQLPLSTMPGEFVEHTYAGAMAPETVHFLEAVVYDRPVLVTPEHARMVMEVYIAADLSAERNAAVDLPCEKPRSGSASRSSARAA